MKKRYIWIIAAALLLVIVAMSSAYVVAENEHACVMRFNKIESVPQHPSEPVQASHVNRDLLQESDTYKAL